MKTLLERPEPSRSDCHAWSTHPLFHFYTTILGIRPAQYGLREVTISPRLHTLTQVSGRMAHPLGMIEVSIRRQEGMLDVDVELPEGLTGVFEYGGKSWPLAPGRQQLRN